MEHTRLPDWVAMETKQPYLAQQQEWKPLSNLLLKLERVPAHFKEYDDKIKEQLAEGIAEEAPTITTSKEFYIPHKPVTTNQAISRND